MLINWNIGRVKRIWHLSPMRAAKVQASLRIRAVSPEPPLLAHTSSGSRGTFRQKARSLAPLNGWACAVKICHDGMLEDTKSLDAAQLKCSKIDRMRYILTRTSYPLKLFTINSWLTHTFLRDLAVCLKVPLDSMLVWASSGGSGVTARMRRLSWTFAARIGDKYTKFAWRGPHHTRSNYLRLTAD